MPELPDVEIFKQYLDLTSLHKKIRECRVTDSRILEGTTQRNLSRLLNNNEFENTHRRGKYLFVTVNNKYLLLHFGMTGKLKYYKNNNQPDYAKAIISFENGYHLAYISSRLLGKIRMINSIDDFITEQKLGLDAMNISKEDFLQLLKSSKQSAKTMLMNQKKIAGIGNIYSDEILFQAGINPETSVRTLSRKKIHELYRTMRMVLRRAIQRKADPSKLPGSYMLPHRNKNRKCPRCKGEFQTKKVGGRTAYYCPACQK